MSIWAKWVEADGRYHFGLSDNGGIEITLSRHQELIDAGAAGQIIQPGKNGKPAIVDPAPPSDDLLRDRERAWRDAELARNEWIVTRHREQIELEQSPTLTAEQFIELLTYRQALRDWPSGTEFPSVEQRPASPGWLQDQPALPL
ncbi:phage tail assembly chaperone [Pseudomonas sp. Irchel 3E13]|uniref:phage tail assembly chaperone n=1 Tax=Pseudomonas sp. Irchel 3E13 TaxID=2008975 RepID=UPI000BA2C596|nr:phage tail assembly chaperone [Pseudomonas sp. Irchel 3E13]